jgi:hypothetical protein
MQLGGTFRELIDETNSFSSLRWVVIFVLVVTTLIFWGTWMGICIINKTIVELPTGVVTAFSASNLTLIGGKILQRIFGEKNETITTTIEKTGTTK